MISAQKANTANAFSLPGLALSTANIFSAVQPGGSLYGLQFSNPVDTSVAYGGDPTAYGRPTTRWSASTSAVSTCSAAVWRSMPATARCSAQFGVSGDSSCADHNIAWKTRDALKLDYVPAGVSATKDDNIVYDIDADGVSASGWGHLNVPPIQPRLALICRRLTRLARNRQ